jgi:hypothetical protein
MPSCETIGTEPLMQLCAHQVVKDQFGDPRVSDAAKGTVAAHLTHSGN